MTSGLCQNGGSARHMPGCFFGTESVFKLLNHWSFWLPKKISSTRPPFWPQINDWIFVELVSRPFFHRQRLGIRQNNPNHPKPLGFCLKKNRYAVAENLSHKEKKLGTPRCWNALTLTFHSFLWFISLWWLGSQLWNLTTLLNYI